MTMILAWWNCCQCIQSGSDLDDALHDPSCILLNCLSIPFMEYCVTHCNSDCTTLWPWRLGVWCKKTGCEAVRPKWCWPGKDPTLIPQKNHNQIVDNRIHVFHCTVIWFQYSYFGQTVPKRAPHVNMARCSGYRSRRNKHSAHSWASLVHLWPSQCTQNILNS